ncbi:MAG: hypothetical protein WAV00_08185 [Nocardioides sp.]
MRIAKLGGILAAMAITAGTTAVVTAAPAQAATAATAALDISGRTSVKAAYGTYIGLLGGSVTYTAFDNSTQPVNAGTADLERRLPGGAWTVVRTFDTATGTSLSFGTFGSHAKGNVSYRVHYLGGTGTDPTNGDAPTTWDPTYSNVVTVGTYWQFNDKGSCIPRCHIYGKLAPAAKHHRILVQVKHGTWKRYAVVYTNLRSQYRVNVTPTRYGAKYRLVVGPTTHLLKTISQTWTATRA